MGNTNTNFKYTKIGSYACLAVGPTYIYIETYVRDETGRELNNVISVDQNVIDAIKSKIASYSIEWSPVPDVMDMNLVSNSGDSLMLYHVVVSKQPRDDLQ